MDKSEAVTDMHNHNDNLIVNAVLTDDLALFGAVGLLPNT